MWNAVAENCQKPELHLHCMKQTVTMAISTSSSSTIIAGTLVATIASIGSAFIANVVAVSH